MKILPAFLVVISFLLFNVGCSDRTATSTPIPTNTLIPTFTPIPSPTATNIPVHDIRVLAFHDYNGNGTMDQGEPPLEGILNKAAGKECITRIDGLCELIGVPEGKQTVTIFDKRPIEKFEMVRFIFPSVSEVRTLSQGIGLIVNGEMEIHEPLGQGFLTYPFSQDTLFNVSNFVDLDPTFCSTPDDHSHTCSNLLDWQGKKMTYDDHTGIDFLATEGTQILSASPGKVVSTGSDSAWGNFIFIEIFPSNIIRYGHLNDIYVKEGDFVIRGQEIGTVGSTGNSSRPHLHFELLVNEKFTDPYHKISSQSSLNYWILLNSPVIE